MRPRGSTVTFSSRKSPPAETTLNPINDEHRLDQKRVSIWERPAEPLTQGAFIWERSANAVSVSDHAWEAPGATFLGRPAVRFSTGVHGTPGPVPAQAPGSPRKEPNM